MRHHPFQIKASKADGQTVLHRGSGMHPTDSQLHQLGWATKCIAKQKRKDALSGSCEVRSRQGEAWKGEQ